MKVICTTVIRGATDFELSGRIIEIELPTGEIQMSMNLPENGEIVGPRGGSRGGRGVRVYQDKIFVAIYNRILVYDLSWNLLSAIRHPHIVGHHEIHIEPDGIWCCSTAVDMIAKLDFNGNVLFEWWAGEEEAFVAWTNSKFIKWDRNFDYSAHLDPSGLELYPGKQYHINNVYRAGAKVYAYDANNSAFFSVWPAFEPLAKNSAWDHAHNVCLRGRDILVNNSACRTFEIWRMPGHLKTHSEETPYLISRVEVVPGTGKSTQFSTSGWIRGRIQLARNEFIVGSNPASLYHIRDGKILHVWQVGHDVNEAIHGLTLKHPDIRGLRPKMSFPSYRVIRELFTRCRRK
jgi:hypothetical protein